MKRLNNSQVVENEDHDSLDDQIVYLSIKDEDEGRSEEPFGKPELPNVEFKGRGRRKRDSKDGDKQKRKRKPQSAEEKQRQSVAREEAKKLKDEEKRRKELGVMISLATVPIMNYEQYDSATKIKLQEMVELAMSGLTEDKLRPFKLWHFQKYSVADMKLSISENDKKADKALDKLNC